MKKIFIVTFFILIILNTFFGINLVHAENYTEYQYLEFDDEEFVLMDEWTDIRKDRYYSQLKQKKMFGWDKYYSFKKVPFRYVKDTLYHVKNSGSNEIVHTFKYEESEESTIQRSVSGSLELSGNLEKDKKFKFGLESEIKFDYKDTTKRSESETDSIKITIDPNSELFIIVEGEGYIYQGVARKFFFWVPTKIGGFEYVIITAEYYSIDIEKIVSED